MNSEIFNDIIDHINKSNAKQEEKQRKKKERALLLEQYKTKPIYESETITIYHPTNENESKYHGQNTKWCTSGDTVNLFTTYNNDGPLYVIQKKDGKVTDKYQLHVAKQEFKNADKDQTNVTIPFFLKLLLEMILTPLYLCIMKFL